MRHLLLLLLLSPAFAQPVHRTPRALDPESVERFAKLAWLCVHKEYPNKISHTMNSDEDVAPPRKLTPAFYGCYDWHSAVHGHWLLARIARTYPDAHFAAPARAALRQSFTPENVAQEVRYLKAEGRASFERPYGLAWLLQLSAELTEWGRNDSEAATLAQTLRPLELAAVERLKTWLPKLSHPVRSGEHSQSAFALGLMLDYARTVKDLEFEKLVAEKIRTFYAADKRCPLDYEPSGEDFLSPCLAEADAMRRVLDPKAYRTWLQAFLPSLFAAKVQPWLEPAVVTDPSDPKLAHLDGLNLSRAWMLDGVASAMSGDARSTVSQRAARRRLLAAAHAHRQAGLASVTGKHYEGGHWLGSFAVYLVTERGLR